MTPKEKAQELFYKMLKHSFSDENVSALHRAKQCALIAVDEVLNDDWYIATREDLLARKEYWQEVKKEINNL